MMVVDRVSGVFLHGWEGEITRATADNPIPMSKQVALNELNSFRNKAHEVGEYERNWRGEMKWWI